MASPQPIPESTLRLTRTFPAKREEVFRAWTDAKALARWLHPSDEFVTRVPVLELFPGGRYRVEMQIGDSTHVVVGEYREIRAPERLVFTWRWEKSDMAAGFDDTVITLEFHDRGGSTELVLIHEKLASVEDREKHDHGWKGCLGELGRYLSERSA